MAYTRLPTEEELAGTGCAVSDYEEEAEVWPENWDAWTLFRRMNTQWDSAFKGTTGLKYEVLFKFLDRLGLEESDWWAMFDDLQILEAAALDEIHKNH